MLAARRWAPITGLPSIMCTSARLAKGPKPISAPARILTTAWAAVRTSGYRLDSWTIRASSRASASLGVRIVSVVVFSVMVGSSRSRTVGPHAQPSVVSLQGQEDFGAPGSAGLCRPLVEEVQDLLWQVEHDPGL